MFPSKQSPRYRTGTIVCLSFSIGICVFSTLTTLYLRRANRRKVERREELLAPFQGMENGEQEAWRRLGDRHPDFKCVYLMTVQLIADGDTQVYVLRGRTGPKRCVQACTMQCGFVQKSCDHLCVYKRTKVHIRCEGAPTSA